MSARLLAMGLAGIVCILSGLLLASYSEVASLHQSVRDLRDELAISEKLRTEMALAHNEEVKKNLAHEMKLREDQLQYAYEHDDSFLSQPVPDSVLAPIQAGGAR